MTSRATRPGFSLVVASAACAALLLVGGCTATEESPSDAPPDALLHGDDAEGDDGVAPNDDPNLGADTVDVDDEAESEEGEEGTVSSALAARGGSCVRGGAYCGGDKLSGDPKTLYRCNRPNAPTVIHRCAAGCSVNPGTDDSCKAVSGSRAASPVPGRNVTYSYGVRNRRYAAGFHTGQDYATATGTKAVAVRSGTIRWSNDSGGAYGRWIGLDADNGRTYVYCHLSQRLVASGTRVVAGQQIARTGATGNVTGPHLHFEDHPRGRFVYGQVRKPSW